MGLGVKLELYLAPLVILDPHGDMIWVDAVIMVKFRGVHPYFTQIDAERIWIPPKIKSITYHKNSQNQIKLRMPEARANYLPLLSHTTL